MRSRRSLHTSYLDRAIVFRNSTHRVELIDVDWAQIRRPHGRLLGQQGNADESCATRRAPKLIAGMTAAAAISPTSAIFTPDARRVLL